MSTFSENYRLSRGWASPAVVNPHELAKGVFDLGDTVILEVSREKVDSGYRRGHIPDARFVYWKELAWALPRREFPSPLEMSARLGALGVSENTEVVICGDPIQFGVYVAWVLEMCGHRNVRVLDGGKEYWLAAGLPVTTDLPSYSAVKHAAPSGDLSSRIGREGVLALVGNARSTIVDLRTPEEFVGDRVAGPNALADDGAQARGHIPGAHHLFFKNLLSTDGLFKDRRGLEHEFAKAGVQLAEGREIVTYCRLAHRASLGRFALAHLLGHRPVRVYDGSWTEWGSMVGMPVAAGPQTPPVQLA